jgi:hypothetical protein
MIWGWDVVTPCSSSQSCLHLLHATYKVQCSTHLAARSPRDRARRYVPWHPGWRCGAANQTWSDSNPAPRLGTPPGLLFELLSTRAKRFSARLLLNPPPPSPLYPFQCDETEIRQAQLIAIAHNGGHQADIPALQGPEPGKPSMDSIPRHLASAHRRSASPKCNGC